MPDITPDGKTEAADDNQCHDGEIHDWICCIAAKTPANICIRKHIKACVAERGDRMKYAVPQSFSKAELRQETNKQDKRACTFDRSRATQDVAHKTHNAAIAVAAKRLRQNHAFPQTDLPAKRKEKQARDGHKSETADLDEQEDDNLTEHGPMGSGVNTDKACDAGRGGCGE